MDDIIEWRDKSLSLLLNLSDRQFDDNAKRRVKLLLGRPNEEIKYELLGLIDDIVYYAWSSDFVLLVLNVIFKSIGGTDDDIRKRNVDLTPENIAKYKWER